MPKVAQLGIGPHALSCPWIGAQKHCRPPRGCFPPFSAGLNNGCSLLPLEPLGATLVRHS